MKCDEWAVEKRDSILCTYVEHGGLNFGGKYNLGKHILCKKSIDF